MSTATLKKPIYPHTTTHTKVLGRTRFFCIQQNCDGTHHVWCSCGR